MVQPGIAPGAVVDGRYDVVRALGRGGLGSVFEARDRLFERDVALKALRLGSASAVEAFRREFSLLAACAHPRLPRAYDFARTTSGGAPLTYTTAELIRGRTLAEHARGRAFRAALPVLLDALDALGWLHGAGIVHGDFKPDNVLVRDDGAGVLIDLSAARRMRAAAEDLSGTARFLAPELLQGAAPSARSDLFAVGRTLEDLFPLFSGASGAPPAARRLAERLTAEDPASRPSGVEEVLETLSAGGLPRRAPAVVSEPGEIVGRERELEAFGAALEALLRGERGPRAVVVTGEEGAGKSRLFRELKWRAQLRAPVFEGAPRGDDPIRALLRRALGGGSLPAGVDALLGARGELARARADRAERPRVLAIDDADRLGAHDRALLEALVRSTEPTDALLWLIASADRLGVGGGAVIELPLGPLGEEAVRVWTAPLATAARVSDLLRASGGRPRALKELCAALAQRRLSEAELDRFVDTTGTPELWRRRVAALDRGEARALAALAVADPLGPDAAAALGVGRAALDALEAAGLARLDGDGHRLGQPGQARALVRWLDAGVVREVARALADHLAGAEEGALAPARSSQRAADRARALALAGDHEAARRALAASEPMFEWAPRAWVRAADAACAAMPEARTLVAAASALEAAGDPRRALSLLARARRGTRASRRGAPAPPPGVGAELSYRAARCYEKLGKVARALRQLARARALSAGAVDVRLASLSARCLLRLGRYDEARREAEGALAVAEAAAALPAGEAAPSPGAAASLAGSAAGAAASVAAELAETLGLALGYLSDQAGALRSLARAVALRPASDSPRARVRTLSYHALHAYRAGDTALSARGFQDALDLAEAEGLGDLLATAALNLGTARHQLGDWGAALRCYERGLRAAAAFAKERTEATLRFNLAKIHADIGLLERAELGVARLRAPEGAEVPGEIAAAALGLAAEIAAARGALGEAARLLEEACAGHAARGSKREACEAMIHAAEVALAARDRAAAGARLAEAAALLRETDAADLALRRATAGAELALALGDTDAALAEVQRGADLVARVSQLELHARHEEVSAEVLRLRSAAALAERHRTAALECWERIGSTLPAELAEVFWRHPRRAALRGGPAQPAARMELVMKLLEVNRRLSSTLDAEEVLRLAMDAAIELTGAERGFVILASPSPSPSPPVDARAKVRLEVAVARNLDRERIGKSQLKFSHGIAKRVVERGEAVLTVDALADERFHGNASVHSLRLRSIVCVPIRAHGAVLGAVYLDNRFQRGKFAAGDADLLGAFADQIAVALHNGRLMAELRDRTRALEEEQRRVAELMRSQADEIERLSHELERTRADARRDFPEIAGRSAPMRAVLALCERVANSDVTVTVTGESGTGKELVARAIHSGGPRREGPFVAVNCAALPEALLESELFGHVRGAFTGAVRDHGGLFLSARGGTLFLDELGEMPVAVQAKLLRALQEREIRPVGSDRSIPVPDVRVVCATNRDLREEVARGRFREDLYYRISVIEIRLPPLRDRPDDIPAIAQAIVEKLAARQGRPAFRLSRGALRRLATYGWPGNVRQLENVLARACVLAPGPEIGPADIQLPAAAPAPRGRSRADYRGAEEERIRAALELSRWNVCDVSRSLGIPRTTLYRKLARYGLLRRE
ncbi:sigma 54-interacting transcriptional regulator [Sorangium sp. So ce291]|uniref:sigma 54-interacting transcriptional regulator n=1 Tax=Sorangium sp. So ce291 TaxID=3133294 RepID=UPI003F5ED6C0